MKIPQKSRYTNGFYMNGTGSTRDQMRHIIYINIDKGNGEPSIYNIILYVPLPSPYRQHLLTMNYESIFTIRNLKM